MGKETARQRYVRLLKELSIAQGEHVYGPLVKTPQEDVVAIHDMHGMGLVDGTLDWDERGRPGRAFNVRITIVGGERLDEWVAEPPEEKSRLVSRFILAGKIATAALAIWGLYKLLLPRLP